MRVQLVKPPTHSPVNSSRILRKPGVPLSIMPSYLESSLAKLEEFEGSIPWMYRDTEGNVTVGIGLLLATPAAALRLPFQLASVPATPEAIQAEYARVDALPMGRPALFYRGKDKPELAKSEIDSLLLAVLLGFEGDLRAAIPTYDALPDTVKMALLDMAYNLGPAGLLHGYPRLLKAVAAGDWATAAANCERRGPGAARNAWTREQFLSHVVATIEAVGESALSRLGYGLLGLGATMLDKLRNTR